MTTQKKTENEARLKQLASDIQAGHRRCIDGIRGLISLARLNGQWLEEARKLVPHGYWLAWVKDHCHFTPRMAQRYMLVARHYDALVARFNTQDEWTLTEFFAVAAELESGAKQVRDGKESPGGKGLKKAPADAFRLAKRERRKKLKEVEKIKRNGPLAVETSEPFKNFLKGQRERLLKAIRNFTGSKDIKEVAGDLDPVHLGIMLLEGLKVQFDADGLFALPAPADAADATNAAKPPKKHYRIGHLLNGRLKKAVA